MARGIVSTQSMLKLFEQRRSKRNSNNEWENTLLLESNCKNVHRVSSNQVEKIHSLSGILMRYKTQLENEENENSDLLNGFSIVNFFGLSYTKIQKKDAVDALLMVCHSKKDKHNKIIDLEALLGTKESGVFHQGRLGLIISTWFRVKKEPPVIQANVI
jgi:hypothetical protein